ncbi:MAG: leucine--tRNA ligase [Gammaproteobacteria bacterium]|nr:leucine--tRNA ligase [Gammaproteobacteria bacterium]
MQHYDFEQVEREAQAHWADNNTFVVTEDPNKPKYFCMSMLPYPSGALHMGHVRNYTIGDVISRFKKMQGFNVMQPMGWDAFGMPAENAAIDRGVHPAKWTYSNIANMKSQLQQLGFAYDWTREVTTCRPDYYRWEQWFFTKLVEKGIAYKKGGFVNWCEVDQTVLANEQVEEGCCWRCRTPVERREIPQWYLKITDYAEELLNEIDNLDGWPESVKTMQRNWIGRSEGVEFDWAVAGSDAKVRVYTTRPDTVMGVTFMAVAAEHPLASQAAANNPALAAFCEECKRSGTSEAVVETMEKKGMDTGLKVIHPVTGEEVPVWVGNYVLITYGGGAVMGVPGHDQRDYDFAKKYGIEIVQVVDSTESPVTLDEEAYLAKGGATKLVNSGQFDGLDFNAAFDAIATYLEANAGGERKVNYRLRDWLVSRQRYWGCPIPIIYDDAGNPFPVAESDLPVILPEDAEFTGVVSPLKTSDTFAATTFPDGRLAKRETDTFDTFFESSWYYARYCCPDADGMLDDRANYWLPVDQYIGGIEHAVMHLLYFRFFHKLMRDIGLVTSDEPCTNLLTQGMVVSETFYREVDGRKKYFYPTEVEVEHDERGRIVGAKLTADGQPVTVGNIEKMSKSKNNGVDPNDMIGKFGADTVRLFSMFGSPPEQSLEWRESGVEGMQRFLRRLWRQAVELATEPAFAVDAAKLDKESKDLRRKAHEALGKVTDDYCRRYAFNTAIAALMEVSNDLQKFELSNDNRKAVAHEVLRMLLLMLSPITPHICHVLWGILGNDGIIAEATWPSVDESALARDSLEIVVQVNGKLRGKIDVAADADKASVLATAKANPAIAKFLEDGNLVKEIVVPGKLVNLVVK